MKIVYSFFFIFILFAGTAAPAVITVPGNYPTIQAAINASSNGDTILVEPGTYLENINLRGKKIVLTSRFYLNYELSYVNSTVINGSSPSNPDTASCIIINSGEDSTAVVQGFTITGGAGTKWLDEHGAGLYREGGGILIQYSSPVIRHNVIKNNLVTNLLGVASTGGGAIRAGDGNPRILNNIIMYNTARYGAGVVLNYTGCVMKNNVIIQNYGSFQYGGGSGIWINNNFSAAPKLIENNTIVSNSATSGTGGILVLQTSATLRNNIIWGNTPTQVLLQGGSVTVSYSNVQGGWTGTGNINLDPQFTDTNYVLSTNSPCVDAGDPDAAYNDPPDSLNPALAKFPARGSRRNDMGAYGGPGSRALLNTVIGVISYGNQNPSSFRLYQNYPNPFNPVTYIKFDVPPEGTVPGTVRLAVYDIKGSEVAVPVNEVLSPGSYAVYFDASKLSSGVYFYRLTAGSFTTTKKMLLVK